MYLPHPPARAAPPYPLRNNRTPAPDPPSVIYRKLGAPCDISVLNFRSPTLPPICDGILDDAFIEGQELDFGPQEGDCARGGDELVDDDVSFNDNDALDDDDDDEDYENGKDDDPNGLDYSSSDDDDNNLRFDADLEEFELVDFADPTAGRRRRLIVVVIRMVRHLLIIRVCLQLRRKLQRKHTT